MGKFKPWSIAGGDNGRGYIKIRVADKKFSAHRLAWLYMTGRLPKEQIDHIDGVHSNNSWENLREATAKQNCENLPLKRNNISGFRGVSWHAKNKKWVAIVGHQRKYYRLGYFNTAEEAGKAAAAKRAELFTHDTGRDQVNTFA